MTKNAAAIERRRRIRNSIDFRSSVATAIVDLSERGIGVQSDRPLRPGGKCSMRVKGRDGVLELVGLVRWCQLWGTQRKGPGDARPIYRAGIALNKVSPWNSIGAPRSIHLYGGIQP